MEFYVDFETVNDLADDFSRIPQRGGQPLIFMIGCGHAEDGEWVFASFTANSLTEPEEARIIDEWLAYMLAVRDRYLYDDDGHLLAAGHWAPHLDTQVRELTLAASAHQPWDVTP